MTFKIVYLLYFADLILLLLLLAIRFSHWVWFVANVPLNPRSVCSWTFIYMKYFLWQTHLIPPGPEAGEPLFMSEILTNFQNWLNVKSFRAQGDLSEHLPSPFIAFLLWTLINSLRRAHLTCINLQSFLAIRVNYCEQTVKHRSKIKSLNCSCS